MYYTSSPVLRHEFNMYNTDCAIDTCLFSDGTYECMVMFDDDYNSDEIESARSRDREYILAYHMDMVRKYNDKVWNGTPRLLGAKNNGQFVRETYRAF